MDFAPEPYKDVLEGVPPPNQQAVCPCKSASIVTFTHRLPYNLSLH